MRPMIGYGDPGIIFARTDAKAATILDNNSDGRDNPFIFAFFPGGSVKEFADFNAMKKCAIVRLRHAPSNCCERARSTVEGYHRVRGGVEELHCLH
ncbi:hypothetical protein H310_05655 [Aphanomyces invadans]|uniref:Uncharacterized protein n=1 Tax=Aphanomyces invadans TaxID=157072 RepID=A0A024UAF9_9STRA|nr:hypothetical protein H310_05655 [Aphanomyces invadans]ETW03259.1 hypothetical protein H310_05655 [Aphanomyces invadans]|eukprot:XP_008868643.1 hypothetical protein H310_05655 [Aphanomyces invadans]